MTPKTLRLLAIALSLLAVSVSQGEDPERLTAENWVPLPAQEQNSNAGPEFPDPIPLESAFPDDQSAPPLPAEPIHPELKLDSPPVAIDDADEDEDLFGRPYNAPGWYSRPEWDHLNWRSGANSRLGEFSMEGVSAYPFETWEGLSFTSGHGFHWLDGPSISDMPPRLFDFNWGLHYFGEVMDTAWLDMAFSAGIYTDFEDSAREGWRYPAHAVFSWELVPDVQPVVGVKYYARDNLKLLPVAGAIWQPDEDIRLELVFPEPSVALQVYEGEDSEHWISLSGRIGGGEWAIEREPSGLADVVTYNSYQLILGLDTIDDSYKIQSLEIGYSFERELEYRSGLGNFDPAETMFIRLVTRR
jgi:hypothetical protein